MTGIHNILFPRIFFFLHLNDATLKQNQNMYTQQNNHVMQKFISLVPLWYVFQNILLLTKLADCYF